MNCIFCSIINGDIPSYTIYEDDIVKVFLDVNPVNNGHLLIIPKNHYENLLDIDTKVLEHIQTISKKMYKLLKDKLDIEGLTICQNNEYGQEIKHYHLHLIPRYKNDKIRISSVLEKNDVKNIYERLK